MKMIHSLIFCMAALTVSANTDAGSELEMASVSAAFGPKALIADFRVPEPVPFKSLSRVEISLRDSAEAEFFRGMYNASSEVSPIPPTAFGVFPVGEKDSFDLHDVRSAGLGAAYPAESLSAILLPDTSAGNSNGILRIEWWIQPKTWPPADPLVRIYGRALSDKSDDAEWMWLGDFNFAGNVPAAEDTGGASGSSADAPPYSALYDQVVQLESAGEILAALRLIPSVYACDIPVDAFYQTLEETRIRLLNRLIGEGSVQTGKFTMEFSTLRALFAGNELAKPDVLAHRMVVSGDLPVERYFYFMAVAGREPEETDPDSLLTPALPDVDPAALISSPDPWLVSAALFLARKNCGVVSAQSVINRWSSRRDLWDDVCTGQALLFLASQDAAGLSALKTENADVERELRRLTPASAEKAEIHALFYDANTLQPVPPQGVTLVRSGTDASDAEPVQIPESESVISVDPGSYTIKYLDGAVHGSSRGFEAAAGRFIRVCTPVVGGI